MSPPGKEERADHVAIRREGQPRAPDLQDGLVVEPLEVRVPERGQEATRNKIGGQPAAAAVAEQDALRIRERRGAAQREAAIGAAVR